MIVASVSVRPEGGVLLVRRVALETGQAEPGFGTDRSFPEQTAPSVDAIAIGPGGVAVAGYRYPNYGTSGTNQAFLSLVTQDGKPCAAIDAPTADPYSTAAAVQDDGKVLWATRSGQDATIRRYGAFSGACG